jgi:3-isopropylmalate/(R)-2-methylmalate dehydratase small subunit
MGKVVLKLGKDISTDDIYPGRFMATVLPTETPQFCFNDRTEFNAKLRAKAIPPGSVIVGDDNFGCGSSREHAPWALEQYGFRALIAPSYADIFFNNCFKNGILPIVLPASQVDRLFDEVAAFPGYQLAIDLPRQVVVKPDGSELPFEVQPFRKYCLVNGFDDIGLTLRHADKIRAFEAERLAKMPWLNQRMVG